MLGVRPHRPTSSLALIDTHCYYASLSVERSLRRPRPARPEQQCGVTANFAEKVADGLNQKSRPKQLRKSCNPVRQLHPFHFSRLDAKL